MTFRHPVRYISQILITPLGIRKGSIHLSSLWSPIFSTSSTLSTLPTVASFKQGIAHPYRIRHRQLPVLRPGCTFSRLSWLSTYTSRVLTPNSLSYCPILVPHIQGLLQYAW